MNNKKTVEFTATVDVIGKLN